MSYVLSVIEINIKENLHLYIIAFSKASMENMKKPQNQLTFNY